MSESEVTKEAFKCMEGKKGAGLCCYLVDLFTKGVSKTGLNIGEILADYLQMQRLA